MATQQAGGLHSLATIIKRLEAATSRIEDIVASQGSLVPGAAPAQAATPTSGSTATGAAAPPPPPPPPPPPVAQEPAVRETPKSVTAFDEQVLEGKVKPFVKLSKELGDESVSELADLIEKQYAALRSFLLIAATCQKPDQKALEGLLRDLEESIKAIPKAKEARRSTGSRDFAQHLTFMAEGAPAIGWVVSPTPAPYVGDVKESTEFWGNRIIKEWKEKNPKHVEFVRAFMAIFDAMRAFAKEHHTAGLVWNAKGIPYDQYKSPAAGAPAPPPPPPPAPKAATAPAGGAASVFAELNKGEAITQGLRKVDKSEMTHKNPALRAGSTVPSAPTPAGKKPIKPTKPSALAGKKPPKFVLEGNKWLIEWQENESQLVVENVEINQSVNIFNCKQSTIIIKGKVNAVTIHNSSKTAVLVESVVSSVSVTASPSFTLQVTGTAPMIQVDSTDSGQIYLSNSSLNAEITTAKCSAINVSLPVPGEEDGVFDEHPVPEMLRTVVKDGKLVTTVVEHVG
ncbi:adenylyl cyclase-associated protein [Coprinopsis cinerea okayama7|uniref:Adenylyl cyclase-associated protein n=1 Tax=Coprinopsis cinerea (strain Okayama-7 / 130 / ATCC MYA-4618 / FGSC 9003) TaxID=240176 RepID=A8NH62_COPC7|nr:adenylyl cyclase-associated protein [Coprinopsis cinerea okayama7\|eukprot:XP_001833691.1 adenylyl cyclase-associated protein [Coprinopsis cinerea okayama7\